MKRYIINIFVFIGSFFACLGIVSADVVSNWSAITVDGNKTTYIYDNVASGYESKDNIDYPIGHFTLNIDGMEYIAYCIEFGIELVWGSSQGENLFEYFSNVLGEKKAEELISTISLYARYGYGSSNDKKTDKYFLATQQLIWQAISDTGFYASEYYLSRANSVEGTSFVPTKISNLRWVTVTSNDSVISEINVSSEISAIKKAVANYYVTPSFCSMKERVEFELGETISLTDNNKVLSNYKVVCDEGLDCKTNGDKLTITDVADAGNKGIYFVKDKVTSSKNYIYRHNGTQGLIVDPGTIAEVSCQFGVNSFQNVKTADFKILFVVAAGLLSGVAAYIIYSSRKMLKSL